MKLLAMSILVVGCGGAAAPTPATFPSGWRVIDLTHVLEPDIPTYVGEPGIQAKTLTTVERDGFYVNEVTFVDHVGTHVDAPAHFVSGAPAIDQVAVERLVLEAAVIDVTAAVEENADYALTVDDVRRWEKRHEPLGAKHIVIVRTGWSSRWPDAARYRNPDAEGVMHFPGVSLGASQLLRARGVPAIGIDTLSTDPGASKTFEEHKDFHGGGGYHVENLANLHELPEAGAVIVVAPLPLLDGSGSPARVIAFVPNR